MADPNQAQGQSKGQDKKPPVKVTVTLEYSEPQKTSTGFLIRVNSIVAQGEKVLEGKTVRFFADFGAVKPETAENETDDTGRAYANFFIPIGKEKVVLEAQLVGSPSRSAKQTIVLPEEKKISKKPHDLEVKASGKDGHFFINMTAITEDGTGVKSKIRILTPRGVHPPKDQPTQNLHETDDSGVAYTELKTIGRQEEIRFLVLGTSIDKTLRLSGPKKKGPAFSEASCSKKGFFKSFKEGLEARGKAEEKAAGEQNGKKRRKRR